MASSDYSHTLLLVCAYPAEAAPLARLLELRKQPLPGLEDCWRDPERGLFLLASGRGVVAQAVATGFALGRLSGADQPPVRALNLGAAACLDTRIPLGSPRHIVKVTEAGGGGSYIPDLLIPSGLDEATLHTVDQPIEPTAHAPAFSRLPLLYDMEAAGFWRACRQFLPSDAIQCLKVVTDHGVPADEPPPLEAMRRHWEQALPSLLPYITAYRDHDAPPRATLPPPVRRATEALAESLRLTATQKSTLERDVLYAITRGGSPAPVLESYLSTERPRHARDRKRILEKLHHELLES